jgi:predicted RNA-binding protein with PUA-like domain
MPHWLYKSEPFKWSWDDQVKAGAKGTYWDGVRNHSAKLNLMAMKRGDQGFFYHSNEGLEIVGIVEVIKEAYPDPTAEPGGSWST